MNKEYILDLVVKDEIENAVYELIEIQKKSNEIEFLNLLIALQGRISRVKKDNYQGIIGRDELLKERNIIRSNIIDIIQETFDENQKKGNNNVLVESNLELQKNNNKVWDTYCFNDIQIAINDKECSWVIKWVKGKGIDEIDLIYNTDTENRYDNRISNRLLEQLKNWETSNKDFYMRLAEEPWEMQVRLNKVYFDHLNYKFVIHLSQMKYLYYVSIQAQLGKKELTGLRDSVFNNAVTGLLRNQELKLPSPFALHMAVISSDGKALLRKRTNYTELYPSAWEAGIGEFMHGPSPTSFPHFDNQIKPNLFLYLKNAVAEELNHTETIKEDFKIYGFAIERQTLAPKMIVVYQARLPMKELLKKAELAKDSSPKLLSVNLSTKAISKIFNNKKFTSWGPTSKLALTIALLQYKGGKSNSDILKELKLTIVR